MKYFYTSRLRRVRLVVRTQPSQGWYTGSTPVRAAKPREDDEGFSLCDEFRAWPVSKQATLQAHGRRLSGFVGEAVFLIATRVLPGSPSGRPVGGRPLVCRIEQMRESPSTADRTVAGLS